MATIKLSQLPAAAPGGTTDQIVGVVSGTTDNLYSIAQVLAFGENPSQIDKGTVPAGTVTFDVLASSKQKLTASGSLTVAFTDWGTSGHYAEIEIQLVNGGVGTVTWPTVNWLIGDGTTSTTFANMGVTLASAGTNFVIVWSTDGGATLYGKAA